ncbi:MAG: hypothetical protein IPK16_22895 [Anaerolineales bacterium]|nr:hypothetical protein [Anaerolineales bacterium]
MCSNAQVGEAARVPTQAYMALGDAEVDAQAGAETFGGAFFRSALPASTRFPVTALDFVWCWPAEVGLRPRNLHAGVAAVGAPALRILDDLPTFRLLQASLAEMHTNHPHRIRWRTGRGSTLPSRSGNL